MKAIKNTYQTTFNNTLERDIMLKASILIYRYLTSQHLTSILHNITLLSEVFSGRRNIWCNATIITLFTS